MREIRDDADAHAAIVLLLADLLRHDALEIESESVADFDRADPPERFGDRGGCRLAGTEEVDVLGRPMQFARPNTEEHGALEHESPCLDGS